VKFNWKREVPEDFIVKEVAEYPLTPKGEHYLYLLVKRNLTTKELARIFGFSYAGMKDKLALTSQFVSFEKFVGEFLKRKVSNDSWYILKFIGRVQRKIKIGQLKGNRFAVNLRSFETEGRDWFINYYDVQRVKNNSQRGRELLKKLLEKPKRKLKWSENFYIDAYLSYLWNKSLEKFLMERTKGHFICEKEELFFIPEKGFNYASLPKFWTILGYKKKLLDSESYYREVLKEEGFELEEFLELLKKLRIKGDYRMTYVKVRELKKIGDYLFFFLPKGSYATMFLKHIQKI
jgi:tRNA pseudouridine13 synthase